MRILVVCQRYWPEQFQITDICEGLVERGHDVTVLCGLPNVGLPETEGRVLAEYRYGRNRRQLHNGVKIERAFEIGRRTGVVWRAANYYSFWKSANNMVAKMGDFDVALAYQLSPAMMCDAARVLRKKKGTPYLLYCCDLWPESLKTVLGERWKLMQDHFGRVCRRLYRSADRLVVQSPSFEGYFTGFHGVEPQRLRYVPQFSTDDAEPVLEPHEGMNVLFMGNMGTVQCIPFLLKSFLRARVLAPEAEMRLHFVGDGVSKTDAEAFVRSRNLEDHVVFHGRHPVSEMGRFYALADVCVLALDDKTLVGSTIPSKLQGYMAAGKPVVAAVRGGARFVVGEAHCGFAIDPGDVEGFANALAELAKDDQLRKRLGKNARDYFEQHFTKEAFLDAIDCELSLIGKGR